MKKLPLIPPMLGVLPVAPLLALLAVVSTSNVTAACTPPAEGTGPTALWLARPDQTARAAADLLIKAIRL